MFRPDPTATAPAIVFMLWLLLAGTAMGAAEVDSNDLSATLFAAGDTMLARWMHMEDYGGSVEKLFGNILPAMQNADLAFVNLECVLSDGGAIVEKGEKRPFPYRGRPRMVRFLSEAGIDVVSQANNHAGDYGPKALEDSIAILRSKGIEPLGAGRDMAEAHRVRYLAVGNIMTAWIAVDTQENTFAAKENLAGTFYVSEDAMPKVLAPLIKEAKASADIVIITAHWGVNWAAVPTPNRRLVAHALIDAGADMILGHSSHVLQGMEVYKGKPILYDMGSFLFDTISDKRLRNSMYFEIDLTRSGVRKITGVPISLGWRSVNLAISPIKDRIMRDFIQASKAIDQGFVYESQKNGVVVHIPNDLSSVDRQLDTPIHPIKNDAVALSPFDFSRKPACVLQALPKEVDQSAAVEFENGVRFMGSILKKNVPNNSSFPMRLYFATDKKIDLPACEILIKLYEQKSSKASMPAASYHHEPGDWSYPTPLWAPGEIVEDVHLFRMPNNLSLGRYDVVMSLLTIPASGGGQEILIRSKDGALTQFKIGTIKITQGSAADKVFGLRSYAPMESRN